MSSIPHPIDKNYTYLIVRDQGMYKAYDSSTNIVRFYDTNLIRLLTAVKNEISTSNPAVVQFGVGTFVATSTIDFSSFSNLTVRGAADGATIISADSGTGCDAIGPFAMIPSQTASSHNLTVNATAGDLTYTVSAADAANYAVGDYVLCYSSLSIDTENTGRTQGEIHKLLGVNTSTGVLTLSTGSNDGTHVYQTMLTSDSAKIVKLNMLKNVTIEGITFTDTAASRPGSGFLGLAAFRFIDGLRITNCTFREGYCCGILVGQCLNVKISGNHFNNINDVTPASNTYYGIQVRGATTNINIVNNTFDNMRHGVTQGAGSGSYLVGSTRNMSVIDNCSISSTTAHFDLHQGAEGSVFMGNTMVGDDGAANGIQVRSPAVIVGNFIIGVLGKGISLFGGAHGSKVADNNVRGCTDGIYVTNGVNKVSITNNRIYQGTRGGTFNRSTLAITGITTASPAVISCASHGMTPTARIVFTTTGALPTGLTPGVPYFIVANNITKDQFCVSATEGGTPINTTVDGSGTHTGGVIAGNDSMFCGNHVYENSSYGYQFNGQVNVKVSGNMFARNDKPFVMQDPDSIGSNFMITENFSVNHVTTDLPTVLGSNVIVSNNMGFGRQQTAYAEFASGPQTLTLAHHKVNCTTGTFTLNLFTAVGCAGTELVIWNTGAGTITVDPSGAQTVDGSPTLSLPAGAKVTLTSTGVGWISA